MPPLPPFGPVRIRVCDNCGRYVRCAGWHDHCPKCAAFVIHRQWIEVIEAGVRTKVIDGKKCIVFGPPE